MGPRDATVVKWTPRSAKAGARSLTTLTGPPQPRFRLGSTCKTLTCSTPPGSLWLSALAVAFLHLRAIGVGWPSRASVGVADDSCSVARAKRIVHHFSLDTSSATAPIERLP